jgi:transcriptional regulator with XRE-family HTH domain
MQLKYLRDREGLSVRALAAKAGMSYTYLANVENGKADPSLSTLTRIAKALEVTVSTLVKDPPLRARRR